jgi:drug/metabolite transporter (DMT)-like permease
MSAVSLPSEAAGALFALGSALAWAVIGLMVRTLAPHYSSVTINAARSLVSGAILLAWVAATEDLAAVAGLSPGTVALLGLSIVVASAIGDTVFFESTRALGLGRAMTVSMTYPLMSALLAAALVGEPLTPPVLLGSVITLAGIALIVTARPAEPILAGRFWSGVGAATLAAMAWAVSVVLLKAPLAEIDAVTAQAVRLPIAGAALLMTPWGWAAPAELRRGGLALAWRLFLVSAVTVASSVLFVAGLKYGGVAVATVLSSTAPMFAIPLGFFFLGERLSRRAIVGSVITAGGIAVLQS